MRRGTPDGRPRWSLSLAVLVAVGVFGIGASPALAESTSSTLFVPIVLSSGGAGASFYTSELTLTNRGTTAATVELRYTAAFGGGDGTCVETLLSGEQKIIPDAIAYLRGRGVPIAEGAGRGGTLQATFTGLSSSDAAAATVRTTTATAAPQPLGAAGLSYPGISPANSFGTSATLYGLRTSTDDRSNAAVYNPTTEPVTVRITAFAGDGTGSSVVRDNGLEIPGLGWMQLSGILDGTGITNGWVTVAKTGGSGSFGAYGVINDNRTSDGSFVFPVGGTLQGASLTVPVLVETTAGFTSELVLTNRAAVPAGLTLSYVESLASSLGTGGTFTLDLAPVTQLIIPDAIDYLRGKGLKIGARGAASFAGTLRVSVAGTTLSNVFAGARTATKCPVGGQFGLFTPGIYSGQEASAESYVYGLRADAHNRTNVALVNAGADGEGAVTLEIQAFDGDAGGLARGDPETITLEPGAWQQNSGFLGGRGVENGWVRVRRLSGSAPWIAYGVVNDGGSPGERTGDGAYVQMVAITQAPPAPPSLEILVVAGGAGGGSAGDGAGGGGGGGGGVVHLVGGSWPASALAISVGGGGASNIGGSVSSVFGGGYSLTAIGGGTGGRDQSKNAYGRDGGSGGGGGTDSQGRQTGGSGTQPGTGQTYPAGTLTQFGNRGGRGSFDPEGCGGGGGAGGAGADGRRDPGGPGYGGSGGDGVIIEISGSSAYYGAGGGGSGPGKYNSGFGGPGGAGGGGAGTQGTAASPATGWGAGGGGAGSSQTGGSGFQGVVIIRYLGEQKATGGSVTSSGGYTIHTFTGAGTFLLDS